MKVIDDFNWMRIDEMKPKVEQIVLALKVFAKACILLAIKIKNSFIKASISQDVQCFLWIRFSMSLPSGHAIPLYRLYKGSPSTNMTKSHTLTLSLQSASQRQSFSH